MTPSLPVLANFAGHLTPANNEPQRKSPHEAAEEFFSARISNENTRESYIRDAKQFASWCAGRGFTIEAITAVHIAGYRDQLVKEGKRPAAK